MVSVVILDGLGIGAGSGYPDGERACEYDTSRLHCAAVGNFAEAVFSLFFFPLPFHIFFTFFSFVFFPPVSSLTLPKEAREL